MKRIILFAIAILMFSPALIAERRPEPAAPKENGIIWLSMDDLQVKMKANPKKVYMDMYTDWCGWCKKMEASTFSNPDVIKYMNENFYCVRFNAERKDTFRFMGKEYFFDPAKRANTLAASLMRDQLSYPTSIIMEERYQNPQPIPGYLSVPEFESIVKYFASNSYKSQKWEDYKKAFVPAWKGEQGPVTPPAGH